MDAVFITAEAAGHILVHFDDDDIRALADRGKVRGIRTEVEVAMFVHRRHLNHEDVRLDGSIHIPVIPRKLGILDRAVESAALRDHFPLDPGHMPGVPGEVIPGILALENGRFFHQDAAAQIDVGQLIGARCQRFVQRIRCTGGPAEIDPVAGLYMGNGLCRSDFFAFIGFLKRHIVPP